MVNLFGLYDDARTCQRQNCCQSSVNDTSSKLLDIVKEQKIRKKNWGYS